MKSFGQIIITIALVIGIIYAGYLGINAIRGGGDVTGSAVIGSMSEISTEGAEIYDYHFSNQLYDKDKKLLSEKSGDGSAAYAADYQGTIRAGIDATDVHCQVTKDKQIFVITGPIRVLENKIDENSITITSAVNGKELSAKDRKAFVKTLKQDSGDLALKDGLEKRARQKLKNYLKDQTEQTVKDAGADMDDYKLVIKISEE